MVMSDQFSPVEIVLDANTRSRRIVVGSSLAIPDENQQIDLYYGTQNLFMAKVYKGSPSIPYNFTTGTTFLWGADSVYTPNADPIVSLNAQFHIPGDWAFDPAVGLLCWRANLATTALESLMLSTTNPTLLLHSFLWAFPPSGATIVVAAWDMIVWMPAVNPVTALPVTGVTHLTTDAAAAMYVPIWGDQAYERRKNGRTQVLFADGKWRALIPTLIDGAPVITWGNPED